MNRKPTEPTENIKEEADYVNSAECIVDKTAATSEQKFGSFTRSVPPVAGCWVILIVIMALRIYFTSVISEKNGMLTAENQELTNIIHKLNSAVNNLTVWFDNLNKSYAALESNYTDMIAENQRLETQNQQLETQNQQLDTQINNLTDMLQDKETERNELNVSRAQWSIDQYCPIEGAGRQCKSCQAGWLQDESGCYAFNDPITPYQRTWDGAQADCKGKISGLVVMDNAQEKEYILGRSWTSGEIRGYWIGLRVVDGKWTWVDGSNLTEISWIQPATPTEGHCAISDHYSGLKSVNCSEKNAWICEKKALSLTPPY